MKRYIVIGIVSFSIILLVYLLFAVLLNPSVGRIRKNLLKITPIGTSMEDVIAAVESNEKWKIDYINEDSGYMVDENGNIWRNWMFGSYTVIGEKSIGVSLGIYLKGIYVSAYYGFDENSNLIDILVYKEWDLV